MKFVWQEISDNLKNEENLIIISNLNIEKQHTDIQQKDIETYCAFLRRFETVILYTGFNEYKEYSLHDYLKEFKTNFNPRTFHSKWIKSNYPDLYTNTRSL